MTIHHEIEIALQGGIQVESPLRAWRFKKSVVLRVELEAKYAEVGGATADDDGNPQIIVGDGPHTLYPMGFKGEKGLSTMITFKGFKDWHVACAEINKWTLTAGLEKNDEEEEVAPPPGLSDDEVRWLKDDEPGPHTAEELKRLADEMAKSDEEESP